MKKKRWLKLKILLFVVIAFSLVVWAKECKKTYGQFQSPAMGLSNQSVKGDHIDSTSEDFVFNDAFRITSATGDSMFMTKKYIDDAAGGLVAQSVKGDHIDSTDEDFVFNDAFRITSAQAESIFITKNHVEKTISGTLWVHLDDTSAVLWGAINESTWYALGAAGDTLWAHLDDTSAVLWEAITDSCWLVRQNTSDTLWAHLDESTAVLWGAITDTCWLVRQGISDTLWAHLDESTAVLWEAIKDTAWMLRGVISDSIWQHLDDSTAILWTALTDTSWMLKGAISESLWSHLDDTSAVLWTALTDTAWMLRGAIGDSLWAHLDESTAVLWTAITDTTWMALDAIHDSMYANTPGYLTGNESITLSGDATGSGATAITVTVVDDLHDHVYSNIDATTSANWATRVSDETGTGVWVFGTSPTFTTDITSPLVIGGTATTSDLSLKTTSGVGETGADMHFLVGNNGATEAMTILNDGKVGIGINAPTEKLHITGNNATLKLEDDSGNDATINVGNSQLCLAIDPDDLVESSDICFDIDGDEVARFHQSTNFGIGTLSPSERLSVVGNVVVTGRITSGDTLTRSFVIASPDDTFDFPFWQTKRAITIVAVSAVCTGGTNVIGALQEYNATGTSVDAAVDGDWTITTSEYTDASFTNPGIDAGDWLGWKTTSVSGSVTFFSITFEYTEQ